MSDDQPGWTPPQQPPENPEVTPSGEQPPPPPPPPYGQPVPPQQPFGQPSYPPSYGQPPHPQQPYGQPAYGVMGRDPNARPGTVTAAAVITMVLSGLCAVLFLGLTVIMGVAKDDFLDRMRDEIDKRGDQTFTRSDLESIYGVIVGVMIVMAIWCLIAVVLGVFVLKRSNVARILLVVSASVAALISLIAIGSGASLVTLAGSIAVIVTLFTGGANDWFRNKHAVSGSPTH
jgi:hypothetical protein